jgi:hypothetical protein
LGLATVLGQTVNTCIAKRYDAPQLTVRSCIGRSDDLLLGKSYYRTRSRGSSTSFARATLTGRI